MKMGCVACAVVQLLWFGALGLCMKHYLVCGLSRDGVIRMWSHASCCISCKA